MKKKEVYYCVYNESETQMYGKFTDYHSAEEWKKKITSVVKEPLKINKSDFTLELPDGISFSNEQDEFILNKNMTPMQNMASFIEWSYKQLKEDMTKNYEGLVALEIVKSMLNMSKLLRQSENMSLDEMDDKLRKSHEKFLEAGKIYGIEFMLNYTYDFWRNQDEKDMLVEHYYSLMRNK